MKTIGFSNKYYTIWDVVSETVFYENKSYINTKYHFIQNLSKSKDEAFKKAKELFNTNIFDPHLKGKSRTVFCENIPKNTYDDCIMNIGKFKGEEISSISDANYLIYMYEKSRFNGVREKNVLKRIKELDNSYLTFWDIEKKRVSRNKKLIEMSSKDFIDATIETNINENYELRISISDESTTVSISSEIPLKEMEYRGNFYYLFSKNGKGKRLKNKNVKIKLIDDDQIEGNLMISEIKI